MKARTTTSIGTDENNGSGASKGLAEVAFQQWCDERRRPQVMPDDVEPIWIIRYADQDVADEVFGGHDAEACARRRFDQRRGNWTLSLFREVARG